MATEVVRQVWCDLHLKVKKKKVEGVEKRATALANGKVISIDLCDECYDGLTWRELLALGTPEDAPRQDPTKLSEKLRTKPKSGTRSLVECSFCGKQVTAGSGFALHNKAHLQRNEQGANPIPVAS